jgi:glutamate-1-semialdehyde 2,1-aminomutase
MGYLIRARLRLSLAKHPSLRGHAKWSRRIARLVPYYSFGSDRFFNSDGAPPDVVVRRRTGFDRLIQQVHTRAPKSLEVGAALEHSISDVNFTSAYRVPFPYREGLAQALRQGSIVDSSEGVRLRDIDGNWRYDLSGSYGVNVFGYDFYKECLAEAMRIAGPLGPVLGPYHPVIRDNATRLQAISGLDEISFHMSGTEAVMQAVRLARYHTGRSHLVRLCGAYHGWWDGVQPGVGNPRKTSDVYTLRDLSKRTLKVLESRGDIACVLINPLQALHPNADAAGDATLVSSSRSADFDRARYTRWLQQLRETCTRRGIVLIFDEVFTGFRLAHRGAQEYFGIQADMVTYGKTLGGGLPVGVLCGRRNLMQRFKKEQPANIAFARGTFNSHPYVMAAMNAFLLRVEEPYYQNLYRDADALWNTRARQLNDQLTAARLPLRVANMHSIWTILYTEPSRYNWMFQFYLRDQGLELSWVGSGRLIMSLNYSDDDFAAVMQRFLDAATQMAMDGWWWQSEHLTHRDIRRQLAAEMLRARFGLQPAKSLIQPSPSALSITSPGERHDCRQP